MDGCGEHLHSGGEPHCRKGGHDGRTGQRPHVGSTSGCVLRAGGPDAGGNRRMTSTLIEDGPLLIDDERQAVPMERTRVLVVDDHRTFAELLARALDAESDLECVGHAQDSSEALAAVERLRPDVVLMDVHLPDRDGISTTAELVREHPDLKGVILTAHASLADIERAATAGASGFLAKDGSLFEVADGLRTANSGSLILPDGLLARLSAVGESDRTILAQW